MLEIIASNRFRKDLKLALKRGCKMEQLQSVVDQLAAGQQLAEKYRDPPLSGDCSGFRECHITPYWLLIYQARDR